ncbi:MAG: hypothetical protein CMM01_05085 [Rhodopirellula sp.]|nr:hypothetical protein [Rhodopirellula sp.]
MLGTTRESRTIGVMMTGHLIGPGSILRNLKLCEQAIRAIIDGDKDAFKLQDKIRAQLGPELAGFVVTVANVQAKAKLKLQASDQPQRIWWGTDKSVQQATPWQVARLKSEWFANRTVFDLCCGNGGDSLQLKNRGPVVAVDSDPLIAELAAANLSVQQVDPRAGLQQATPDKDSNSASEYIHQVICSDVTDLDLPAHSWINIDPDRRPDKNKTNARPSHAGTKRISNPDHYHPNWQSVVQLVINSKGACVKLAPAANPDVAQLPDSHRCWISLSGSVREQTLLYGGVRVNSELPASGRSAVVIKSNGSSHWFVATPELVTQRAPITDKPQSWLIDPDAAIRAAGLTDAYAVSHDLSVLGRASGFLTGQKPPTSEQVSISAELLWSGSCDDRKLRRELRQRDFYPAVIKVRGTDHSPEKLTRKYRKCGRTPICLWIGRGKERVYAAFTR